jgi:hypothetical protein
MSAGKAFRLGDEVKVRDDLDLRLGVIGGNRDRVERVTHRGSVVHVYVYSWQRVYVYGASELVLVEERGIA